MTFLAIIVGGVAIAVGLASFAALRAVWQSLEKMSDTVRVLNVSINGLEAALSSDLEATRGAAEAALAESLKLQEAFRDVKVGPDVESASEHNARMSTMGRIAATREFLARAEEESYRAKFGVKAVSGG